MTFQSKQSVADQNPGRAMLFGMALCSFAALLLELAFSGRDPHSHLTCHLVRQTRVRGIAILDASKGNLSTCPETV
jgi:hypothetical protein